MLLTLHAHHRYLKRLAAGEDGKASSSSSKTSTVAARGSSTADNAAAPSDAPLRQWQDSEAVLRLVANDPAMDKKRAHLEAKLDSLQRTGRVLSRFA